jgi:hypothetical protein
MATESTLIGSKEAELLVLGSPPGGSGVDGTAWAGGGTGCGIGWICGCGCG